VLEFYFTATMHGKNPVLSGVGFQKLKSGDNILFTHPQNVDPFIGIKHSRGVARNLFWGISIFFLGGGRYKTEE